MSWVTIEEIDATVAGQTVPKLFLDTVAARPDEVALRAMAGEEAGSWHTWTWRETADLVAKAAAGFQAEGVGPGHVVLLMMRNRPEFHWLDLAAQFVRATPVSIYNSSSPEEVEYLANHAEAEIAVLENYSFLEKFLPVMGSLPKLRKIFLIHEAVGLVPEHIATVDELYSHGSADLPALAAATEPADLATLIYTSGTTGPPKGVMISQYNVCYTVESLALAAGLDVERAAGWRVVSYLPMAHIAERMTSHYQGIRFGYEVTTCPDPTQIATYARETRPHLIFGVPRVWEKVYNGVNAALSLDQEKKTKFDEAVAAALDVKAKQRAGTATQQDLDTWAFLDAVAFSTVRDLVGMDQVQIAVTGAAPIPREILEWFQAIGVPLCEIYGMSESAGPMTWDVTEIRPGTVGRQIPGCEVRIADDGEVICRGGNVFQGYFKAPDKTAETLVDGWLHSGDVGMLDGDGYLKIVDRKKELIITSGGKNISPANLEAALKTIPLVGNAAAIGDNRKFISALVVLDPEYAPVWARNHGIEAASLAELAVHPVVVKEIEAGVEEINGRFAQVEQIKKVAVLGDEWNPDTDVLTPTSKLKRRGISARYADRIEKMYL